MYNFTFQGLGSLVDYYYYYYYYYYYWLTIVPFFSNHHCWSSNVL